MEYQSEDLGIPNRENKRRARLLPPRISGGLHCAACSIGMEPGSGYRWVTRKEDGLKLRAPVCPGCWTAYEDAVDATKAFRPEERARRAESAYKADMARRAYTAR